MSNIDLKNRSATYMDVLKDGDVCSIKWITRRKK